MLEAPAGEHAGEVSSRLEVLEALVPEVLQALLEVLEALP